MSKQGISYLWNSLFIASRVRPCQIKILAQLIKKIDNLKSQMNRLFKFKDVYLNRLREQKHLFARHIPLFYQLIKIDFIQPTHLSYLLREHSDLSDEEQYMIYSWLGPEIESIDSQIALWYYKRLAARTELPELRINAWQICRERRELYGNHHPIARLIREDKSDSLFEIIGKNDPSSMTIPYSPYEVIDFLNHSPTLLEYASFFGSEKCVRLLLSCGANPATPDSNSLTPVHYAIANGQIKILNLFESYPISYEGTTHIATLFHHNELLKWLIDTKGVSVDSVFKSEGTILHCAMRSSNIEAASMAIAVIPATSPTADKMLPIHLAAAEGEAEILQFILGVPNCPIDAPGFKDEAPLHLIAQRGSTWLAKLLIDLGANVNVTDQEERTPLHYASYEGNSQIVQQLISQKQIDVNAQDKNGETPCHIAAEHGKLDVIMALMKASHFDGTIKSKKKETPYQAVNGHKNIKDFMKNNADIFGID